MTTGPWLIPFNGIPRPRCPKCLSKAIQTEYHDTVVVGMCKERRDAVVAMTETPWDVPDETTEHLCQGCFTCGYTWCERVAGPEEMARVMKSGDSDDDD